MLTEIFGLGDEHTATMGILFGYLFGRIGKYEFRSLIGDKAIAKAVWSKAESSGYVLKNCKLFVYAYHYNKSKGMPTSPAKFGIHQSDVALLKKINLNHINLKKFKPYSLFDFNNLEGALLTSPEMDTHIGKFISRKLIFLTRSYGVSREELESQLQQRALYALRKQFPCYDSDLHALNICKTAIHNEGMGIIEYWTREKRNALTKENGVFQAVNVPYTSLTKVGVRPQHEDELRINLKCLVAIAPKLSPKARKFLEAAAGLHDPGFSLFLGIDNDDAAQSWSWDRYMRNLQTYFSVTQQQTTKLLINLRKAMQ